MVRLREYQQDAIDAVGNHFERHRRQFIEMPTGSGKTITFLSYAKQFHEKILIIVPSIELLKQSYETALLFYHRSEVSRKGSKFDERPQKVHICIIHSAKGRILENLVNEPFDLLILDEAHHSQSTSYRRLITELTERGSDPLILGVTATPDRSDGLLLQEILEYCSFKLEVEKMIQDGHLSDIEGFSVKSHIDLSDVDDHNGDFSLRQLYKKLCIDSRNRMILDICKNHMPDRKTLIFLVNIEHSSLVNKLLQENGISSAHIDGDMEAPQRSAILSAFRSGGISVLCNCQLLTEGFDEPSIDGIIIARPTRSRTLFRQMIGRGLRIHPGKKNCKIVDIVDNHKALAGFNSILGDSELSPMGYNLSQLLSFSSFKDIREHAKKEIGSIKDYQLEKTDILNYASIGNSAPLPGMIHYLRENSIQFYEPISFDEASFLIWMNELKKDYLNG